MKIVEGANSGDINDLYKASFNLDAITLLIRLNKKYSEVDFNKFIIEYLKIQSKCIKKYFFNEYFSFDRPLLYPNIDNDLIILKNYSENTCSITNIEKYVFDISDEEYTNYIESYKTRFIAKTKNQNIIQVSSNLLLSKILKTIGLDKKFRIFVDTNDKQAYVMTYDEEEKI